eukprot:TRINITY_DN8165_c0_g1_i1.p1 TRINITY_DN8165_c0_g1~~TRINITY_DN8165_c0_g1_i1.p1  ORF type:complete len:702 (+),score=202.80 TRINITY_DN8165_c0_g1_i1:85-2190(+)
MPIVFEQASLRSIITMSSTTMSPSVWGRPATRPPVSLAAVEQEQQERADVELAQKLQVAESDYHAELLGVEAATAEPDIDADLALAMKLQAMEEQAAGITPSSQPTDDTSQDEALAAALQAQFNQEHDAHINELEKRANGMSPSKVTVSMDKHRSPYPSQAPYHHPEVSQADEEDLWDDDIEEAEYYDKGTRTMRDGQGRIITKHNPLVNGRRNRQKMERDFPIGFASGDMKGKGSDFRLDNKVYNHLRRFANKSARQAARLNEKKDNSTAVMALDRETRLILFKLINRGVLTRVDGVISTGKEAVVLSGMAHSDAEDLTSRVIPCAIKVFKTTLTEFKQRQQFLHGDRRYEHRVGRQHARKLVKVWAEKEMANLKRMEREGLACPKVIMQRQHVLVMSLIGNKYGPAPKLKELVEPPAPLSARKVDKCFATVLDGMRVMYNDCKLVHGDLSEYNLLYHEDQPWFIDVGQSVEPTHPRAQEYLYRDCKNVHDFFARSGADMMTAGDMFELITGQRLAEEIQLDYATKISGGAARGQLKHRDREEAAMDSSNIVLKPESCLPGNAVLRKDLSDDQLEGDSLSDEEISNDQVAQADELLLSMINSVHDDDDVGDEEGGEDTHKVAAAQEPVAATGANDATCADDLADGGDGDSSRVDGDTDEADDTLNQSWVRVEQDDVATLTPTTEADIGLLKDALGLESSR